MSYSCGLNSWCCISPTHERGRHVEVKAGGRRGGWDNTCRQCADIFFVTGSRLVRSHDKQVIILWSPFASAVRVIHTERHGTRHLDVRKTIVRKEYNFLWETYLYIWAVIRREQVFRMSGIGRYCENVIHKMVEDKKIWVERQCQKLIRNVSDWTSRSCEAQPTTIASSTHWSGKREKFRNLLLSFRKEIFLTMLVGPEHGPVLPGKSTAISASLGFRRNKTPNPYWYSAFLLPFPPPSDCLH